jgi:predicted dehydrogenase
MSDVSVCFLGCGNINARHIRTLRRLRSSAAVAVASRDLERARAFGRRVGARDAFGSYDEGIRSAYDIVVVGVPPSAHRPLVEAALAAGKHLLIEKPAFASLADFVALWPALAAHRGTVMVAENLHFAPFQRRLEACLRDAALGRPLILDLVRLGRARPTGWRADPAEMPLGALHEGGVHWIRRLMGLAAAFEPSPVDHVVDVYAAGPPAPVTATPGEDTTMVVARHRSGLVSRLLHTWAVPWRFPLFDTSKLLTERGALYFDARGIFGRLYLPDHRQMLWPELRDAAGFTAMWGHFLECADTGRRPELSLEHVFADFAYLDAAYRSRASGRAETPATPPASLRR